MSRKRVKIRAPVPEKKSRRHQKGFGTRFDPRTVGERVTDGVERKGKVLGELCDAVGIHVTNWSKKIKGTPPFSQGELGLIAEALDAPPGWPFLDWDQALVAQRFKEAGPDALLKALKFLSYDK